MSDASQTYTQSLKTVKMGSSEWSVATYGIVEFLRKHPRWRMTTAIVAVLLGLLFLSSLFGFTLPGASFTVLLLLVPWLLWVCTVSGQDFVLIFPTTQASEERRQAEEQYDQSQKPEDALKLDFKRLNEYYVINQAQARSSFRWSMLSMTLGLVTIIAGVWIFYFRDESPDKFMTSLSVAAGVVVELISAMYLYLHSKTHDRSLLYYDELSRLQRLSMAIALAEEHKSEKSQEDARNTIISQLISSSDMKTPTTGHLEINKDQALGPTTSR